MIRNITMGYLIAGELITLWLLGSVLWKSVPPVPAIFSVIALIVGWPAFVIFGLRRR